MVSLRFRIRLGQQTDVGIGRKDGSGIEVESLRDGDSFRALVGEKSQVRAAPTANALSVYLKLGLSRHQLASTPFT